MQFVPLPADGGWHFVAREHIIAVKHVGPKKTSVVITGGVVLETNEESHAIQKRIEAVPAEPASPSAMGAMPKQRRI